MLTKEDKIFIKMFVNQKVRGDTIN